MPEPRRHHPIYQTDVDIQHFFLETVSLLSTQDDPQDTVSAFVFLLVIWARMTRGTAAHRDICERRRRIQLWRTWDEPNIQRGLAIIMRTRLSVNSGFDTKPAGLDETDPTAVTVMSLHAVTSS